eukprot:gb/GECG01000241.1/.p1 GENE.gb/GECG01000241.1/~~gb/GECG01000241.1/.p1  ORF type:complete len:189 (+),score=11.41 gb/GECG01000241.1/:1-567(+)
MSRLVFRTKSCIQCAHRGQLRWWWRRKRGSFRSFTSDFDAQRYTEEGEPSFLESIQDSKDPDYAPPHVTETFPGLEEMGESLRAPGYYHRLYETPTDEAQQRRVMNAHIRKGIRDRDFAMALDVYEDMPMLGISPGKYTYKTLIGMLAAQDKLAEMDRVYQGNQPPSPIHNIYTSPWILNTVFGLVQT